MAEPQPPRCQILLLVEANLDPAVLARALEAGPVASVILRTAGLEETPLRAAIEEELTG